MLRHLRYILLPLVILTGAASAYEAITAAPTRTAADELPLDIITSQLSANQQSIEKTIEIHLTWFAFACTINATILALIVSERLKFHTVFIPILFIIGNAMGMVTSHFVHEHCTTCANSIEHLLHFFPKLKVVPISGSTLVALTCLFTAAICFLMAAGWVWVVCNWEKYQGGLRRYFKTRLDSVIFRRRV